MMVTVSGRPVAGAGSGEVDIDQLDVGAGQVVDDDVVGAAQGVEVDGLDVVQIHR